MTEPASLIDPSKRIGTVTRATASFVEITLPSALAASGRRGLAKGSVGEFVFIDCDRAAILGRITEVGVPERQRNALEHQTDSDPVVDPQGRIQLLATASKITQKVTRGISTQPRIGDGVFLAEGRALSSAIKDALTGDIDGDGDPLLIELGHLSGLDSATLSIPPEKLFGRHCGVFGATGGGKSWTVSRLVNETVRIGGKCILFDPTGEFTGKIAGAREFAFTRDDTVSDRLVRFPSENLSELDLNALLRPTGQSQGPTLRNAITSLRMARLFLAAPDKFAQSDIGDTGARNIEIKHGQQTFGFVRIEANGTVLKENQQRKPFRQAQLLLSDQLSSDVCDFDLNLLSRQIGKECLSPDTNQGTFGSHQANLLSYNSTLIMRIETLLKSSDMTCFFSNNGRNICNEIELFLDDTNANAMVLSFEHVSFKHDARALLLNALGRHLLTMARDGSFRSRPLVCFLDEAHQFIGRSVGDDINSVNLDAFGLIAKEGRKYGLTTTIATQRPRDVPQDVLSQLGTLFVHRLTNDRDRETIERSCGDLDKSAAAFIPSLSQGEVIVVGPDLPAPLPLMMKRPAKSQQPTSSGPQFQKGWGHRVVE